MQLPTALSNPGYHDEEAARVQLEAIRWPDGPFCPICGGFDRVKPTPTPPKAKGGGWYHCAECRRRFTVRVGSIFHRSHVPLHKWLLGFRLMAGSKKGFSAHQMHRTLGVDLKTAWYLEHRIRECMMDNGGDPLGGKDKVIEADETFLGAPVKGLHRKDNWTFVNDVGWVQKVKDTKLKILTIVERGGRARSIQISQLTSAQVYAILKHNADTESHLNTDEAKHYVRPGKFFASHEAVEHYAEEWVRGDVHTNTVEGFFSIFKRGMKGIYQRCSEKHLHRYLAEFDFRYNNRVALGIDDTERATIAVKGAAGKRLLYRQPRRAA